MSWAARFELRQYLKGSLWVLPLLGGLLGTVLAQLALVVDDAVRLPSAWNYSASTASGVLTAIVGAMVALIGFVVTIGVLVVQTGHGHVVAAVHAAVVPRPAAEGGARDVRGHVHLRVLAAASGRGRLRARHRRHASAGIAVAASIGLLLIYLDRFTHNLRPVAVAALVGTVRAGGARRLRRAAVRGHAAGAAATPARRAGPGGAGRRAGAVQAVDLGAWSPWRSGTAARSCSPASVGDFVTPGTRCRGARGRAPGRGSSCAACSPSAGSGRSSRIPPSRCASSSTSRSRRCPRRSTTRRRRCRCSITSRRSSRSWREPSSDDRYALPGRDGVVRVVIPGRGWAEYLELAVTEIRDYGATSTQVCRRLRALLDGLLATVPSDRRAAVRDELCRLDTAVEAAFPDPVARARASGSDRQGIGGRMPAGSPPGPEDDRSAS